MPKARPRTYLIFTGTGPILVLSSYPKLTDPRLVDPIVGSVPNGSTVRLIYSPQSQDCVAIPDGESIASVCFTNQVAGSTTLTFADMLVANSSGQPISGVTGNPSRLSSCS